MVLSRRSWSRLFGVGFVLHLAAVVAIATLAYLGALPQLVPVLQRHDMLGHAILIGLLAFFLDGALRYRPLLGRRLPWLRTAPVAVLAVAGAEELAQALSPRRTSSLSDLAADVVGVIVLSWLSRWLWARLAKPEPTTEMHPAAELGV